MDELLQQMTPLDFRALVGPEADKLKQKHYLITVVEEVLALAERNQWGLSRKNGRLYAYNGAYWKELLEDDLRAFLQKAAEKFGVDRYDARFAPFGEQLYRQFLSSAYLSSPERSRDIVKINLANGTFDVGIEGQRLRSFDRKDFLTHQLPFAYDPQAEAPLFQAFLDRVQPDKDCQDLLAEYLGYLFVSPAKLKMEKTLLLYGTGANGKSVFFEIVSALLGKENISHYSLQNLTTEPAYCRAHLADKLVNYASEINGKLEANVFKQLVSGEPVEVRLPFGQPFTITDYAKMIFNCNELPSDVEHTPAYFRRFLIVPFKETIPEAEQDRQLATKIIASELSGVFNWVLDGLHRLLKRGCFTDCDAVREQVEAYKLQADSVRTFLAEEGYVPDPERTMTRAELYLHYKSFCQDNGFRFVHSRNFAKRLEGCGIIGTRRSNGHVHFISRAHHII
ncbi:DNA primase family protein [Hymenobacter fodinae]|nr:DNA primase family protein [Hymenobacter fodinae]